MQLSVSVSLSLSTFFSLHFSVSLFLCISLSLYLCLSLSLSLSLSLFSSFLFLSFLSFLELSFLFHYIPHFSVLYCHFILYSTQFNSTQFFSNFDSLGTFLTSSNFIFLYLSSFNLNPSYILISTSYCSKISSRIKFKLIFFYHIFFFNNRSYFIKVCQIIKLILYDLT